MLNKIWWGRFLSKEGLWHAIPAGNHKLLHCITWTEVAAISAKHYKPGLWHVEELTDDLHYILGLREKRRNG